MFLPPEYFHTTKETLNINALGASMPICACAASEDMYERTYP